MARAAALATVVPSACAALLLAAAPSASAQVREIVRADGPLHSFFGGAAATSVAVVDDATITYVTPATASGPLDVGVSHDAGSATLAGGFAATPAVVVDGDFTPGGTVTVHTLCDVGDLLLGIAGAPPATSIPTPPFEGALDINPFFILFAVHGAPSDEFDFVATIPSDPALSGQEALVQALAGPKLTGAGKSGSWTNCAHLTIQ